MKHVYFCRHGLSEMNKAGIFSGQTETPLTNEGKDEARISGKGARNLGIDYIISSTYSRAYDTAKIIAEEIGYPVKQIETSDLLIERNLGALEGQPYDETLDIDMRQIHGAETADELFDRVTKAWQHIQTLPGDAILVVSHGATGRMLRHVIDPTVPFIFENLETRAKYKFPNAVIVQLS